MRTEGELPSICDRTAPTYDVGWGGGEDISVDCGNSVNSVTALACTFSSCTILARMASRGAARRAHSAQMRQIAASRGSVSVTGA
jgi:hypothetical protein